MPFPSQQGSQVYVAGLCGALAAAGHRVLLACYHHGVGPVPTGVELRRARRVPGGDFTRSSLHWSRPLQDLSLARVVARTLRQERVDVIHAHNVEAPVAGWLGRATAGSTAPLIYNLHTLMGEELGAYLPAALSRPARALGGALDALLPRLSQASVAISARSEQALRARAAGRVLHLPPVLDQAARVRGDAVRARVRWGLGDRPWVVYTGNTDAYQDLDALIGAVARSEVLRLLVVSGSPEGPWRALARSLGLEDGRLRWVRSAEFSDTRDALAAATVGAIPRRVCAGFPIKLLNHLGAGLPTVIAEGSAQQVGGQLVVPGGDEVAMAHALERVIADHALRSRLREEALRSADALSWEGALPALLGLYRGLGAGR